jgi:hypothetical protein
MTDTANLALPFIDGSQAQKHVTHNEALRILDAAIQIGVLDMTLTSPPLSPADGERHVVATGATGAWAGQADAIAAWEDGAWRFLVPKPGWSLWSVADSNLFIYDGTHWTGLSGGGAPTLDNAPHVGINSTATSPNLLSVHSNAALFNSIGTADGGTGDARLQISKESSANIASVVFSDAFSGRAEFGLVGSDDFKLKVSDDGTTFVEAFTIDQASGNLALPRGLALTGVISPAQITANQNDYNPAGFASASVLQISSDASRTISGLAGGEEGRVVCILNVGSQTMTLQDENASSAAANRFTLGANLALAAKQAVILRYDGTAARWFALARPGGGGGLTVSSSADLAAAISDETGSGALVFSSSPTLAGTPAAPTAAVDTNTTQIATTAFVVGQASASGDGTPAIDGTAARGNSTHYARADHVHPTDTGRAPASNIALSALAAQANNTLVGNISGSSASPFALNATQATAMLNAMVGDSGSGGTKGLVPAPGSGDAAAGKYLKADGTYAVPPGTGGGGSYPDVNRQNALLEGIYISKLFGGYRRLINEFHDGYKSVSNDGIDAISSSNVTPDSAGGKVSPSPNLATVTINSTNGTDVYGTTQTVFDLTTAITNGRVVQTVGIYSTSALTFSLKIALRNSSGNFTVVVNQSAVHAGGGWQDFTLVSPYTVPGSGSYYLGANTPSTATQAYHTGTSVARQASDTTGTSGAYTEQSNSAIPLRYGYGSGVTNMTLVTTAQTADATVSNGRVLLEYDSTASPTLNTDLTVDVTCDGGVHWTAASLSAMTSYSQAGRKVAESVDQACTAGTSFAVRLKTLNNKAINIYGTSLTVH